MHTCRGSTVTPVAAIAVPGGIKQVSRASKADLRSSSSSGNNSGPPFLSMDVKGAAILAKWSTKRRYTFHIPRNELSLVWVRGGLASANAETFFGWT